MAITISPRVVDISHYNSIGWPKPGSSTQSGFEAAKSAGIWGVIHKATEGISVKDAPMNTRRVAAAAVGLLFGTYHFIRPGNIAQQAASYLAYAKPADTDLMCLDWEDNRVKPAAAREWLERVFQKMGRKPAIYSGNTAKELISGKDAFFGGHRLWLAQYSSKPTVQKSWTTYWLWQYTGDDTGPQPHAIPGIWLGTKAKGIDVNHYDGTAASLRASWAG